MNPILIGLLQVLAGYGIGVDEIINAFMITGIAGLIFTIVLIIHFNPDVR